MRHYDPPYILCSAAICDVHIALEYTMKCFRLFPRCPCDPTNSISLYSRCDGLEVTTQSMLGGIITRPKLSDKLLSKPPFRFLFDIVLEVTKVSGFASTLYTQEEMEPSNVTEKTQKLIFLEKIIRLVGVQLNTVVQAKPLRIIGGYDPQNTNNFLQLLSLAAKHVPDSRGAVRIVLEQQASGSNGAHLQRLACCASNH